LISDFKIEQTSNLSPKEKEDCN